MTTPAQLPYLPPVLMVAVIELYQASWAGRLPNVAPGQLFWASGRDAVNLEANGYATVAPADSYLLPEPPYTVHGTPGLATGVSNSSH